MKKISKSVPGAAGLLIASLAFALAGCGLRTETASTTTTGATTAATGAPVKILGAGSTFVESGHVQVGLRI